MDANDHRLVSASGLIPVGAKQTIPLGQAKTNVTVCFVILY